MAYIMRTTQRNIYYLDSDGCVIARSNGPRGWDYSGKWQILGFATRHNSSRLVSLSAAAAGTPVGQGWIHDLDHGTHRSWGGERLTSIVKVDHVLAEWANAGL